MLRDASVASEQTWGEFERGAGQRDQECERVHRRLKRIVKARGALDAQEAATLREAEALCVWRHFGYGSLVEYMEMEMGYPPRVAIERLRVAKAIESLPVIADAMEQGDLSFSAARELTRVATVETEEAWLEAANDKNVRQVEDLVSGHKQGDTPTDPPDPKLRKRTLRYEEIDPETVAVLRQAKQVLERECGDRLDDDAFLRALGRMAIDGGARVERTRAPYQIAVTVCEQCKRGWQDGGNMTVEMSPPALETALCDAQHIGCVDAPERRTHVGTERIAAPPASRRAKAGGEEPKDTNRTRARHAIPPALRRQVTARDHGRCRVPWCRSSRNVDLHHLEPVAQGGQHTLENLLSLCESHHLAHHCGALIIEGTASDATFKRRGQSSFTIVQNAVDTARALKDLGFRPEQVKTAIEKTRTHVGTTELSLEQWIKTALSYCPRPIT